MNLPCLMLAAVAALSATGQEMQPAQPAAAQDTAIHQLVDSYVAAFNAHDAAALGSQWSPQAVYHNELTGETFVGTAAITDQFTALFAKYPQAKLDVAVGSIEFLSPSVAVERGSATLAAPDLTPDAIPYSAVYVKHDGHWMLDRLTDHQPKVVHSNYDQLKPLEWMVGSWVDSGKDFRVVTSCDWTKNRNFLTRSFTIERNGGVEKSGTQFIGWDPAAKQIRSWTFDSDGSVAEATWSQKNDRWFVHNHGVLADGRPASAVQIIRPMDANSFTWQTTDRTAGGELLPNVDEVLIQRQ